MPNNLFFSVSLLSLIANFMPMQSMHLVQKVLRAGEKFSAQLAKPGALYVPMNSSGRIARASNAKEKKIWSGGFIGCIGTVFYVKTRDTAQYVSMTHFGPGYHQEHLQELQSQMQWMQVHGYGKISFLDKLSFIVIVPGTYTENQKIKYSEGFYEPIAYEMERVIREGFSSSAPLSYQCVPYGMLPQVGKPYYCADMTVTLSNNPTCKISGLDYTCTMEL